MGNNNKSKDKNFSEKQALEREQLKIMDIIASELGKIDSDPKKVNSIMAKLKIEKKGGTEVTKSTPGGGTKKTSKIRSSKKIGKETPTPTPPIDEKKVKKVKKEKRVKKKKKNEWNRFDYQTSRGKI